MSTTVTAITSLSSKHPAYRKRWQLDQQRGISRFVDAAPVRRHLEALRAAGVTRRAIAETANVSPQVVCAILAGAVRTRRPAAARLTAVTLDQIMTRDRGHGFVPQVGSVRRIQALMAIGWRHQDMNAWLRTNRPDIRQRSNLILSKPGHLLERRTAAAITAMYDALWSTPGPSDLTRHRAHRAGYAPPLAWDDDTIDDPAARPAGIEGAMQSRRARLVEDVTELVAQGATVASACQRLGKDPRNLERTLRRADRPDLWAALTGRVPAGARGTEATA